MSLHEHTYKPFGSPQYRNLAVIRIPINFHDVVLDISNICLYIEATFTPNDLTIRCYLSNALAFLFDEIKYEEQGEKVAIVRKLGITSSMKIITSHGSTNLNVLLGAVWGLTQAKQYILDND